MLEVLRVSSVYENPYIRSKRQDSIAILLEMAFYHRCGDAREDAASVDAKVELRKEALKGNWFWWVDLLCH